MPPPLARIRRHLGRALTLGGGGSPFMDEGGGLVSLGLVASEHLLVSPSMEVIDGPD